MEAFGGAGVLAASISLMSDHMGTGTQLPVVHEPQESTGRFMAPDALINNWQGLQGHLGTVPITVMMAAWTLQLSLFR